MKLDKSFTPKDIRDISLLIVLTITMAIASSIDYVPKQTNTGNGATKDIVECENQF